MEILIDSISFYKNFLYFCDALNTKSMEKNGLNNHVDEQYLALVNDIIEHGETKETRAGRTLSLFGKQLRFNLKEGLPILTTKKVFTKGVIHELLWFLKGDTNIEYLIENGVHIWDDDAYRYYLEICKKEGIEPSSQEDLMHELAYSGKKQICDGYCFGDLGPVYGKQWTDWGGHDQIQEVIDKLRNNPDDRRLLVSAWNVEDIPSMALPPCHYSFQFYTRKMTWNERFEWASLHIDDATKKNVELLDEWIPKRKLSCMWNQRSVDTLLGLPFNILSYSILTNMVAQCCNMDVDELIFNGGDCHVYENQIETYEKEQKERCPHKYGLPTLTLNSKIRDIKKFKFEDFAINGYESYPSIKYPLSVGL